VASKSWSRATVGWHASPCGGLPASLSERERA